MSNLKLDTVLSTLESAIQMATVRLVEAEP